MKKIEKTNDYSIFKKCEGNRDINYANLDKLIASIKSRNLLEFRPILVNKQMGVIDGQHRLEAAKKLNVEVWYRIEESLQDEDIILLNANQARWGIQDFINFHATKGNIHYQKFKRFALQEDISEHLLKALVSGRSREFMNKMKTGSFTFPEGNELIDLKDNINKMRQCIDLMKRYSIKQGFYMDSNKFKVALIDFLQLEGVGYATFMKKFTLKFDAMRPCADKTSYIELFKEIYNWKNKEPII